MEANDLAWKFIVSLFSVPSVPQYFCGARRTVPSTAPGTPLVRHPD